MLCLGIAASGVGNECIDEIVQVRVRILVNTGGKVQIPSFELRITENDIEGEMGVQTLCSSP